MKAVVPTVLAPTVLVPSVLALALAASATAASATDYIVRVRPAPAPGGYQKEEVSEAVIGSAPLTVWRNFSLNPDCTATGNASLRVVHPPEHGSVTIANEPLYPNYPKANVRYACNTVKSPGTRAVYTAAEGYVGRDHLVLEGSNGSGVVRRISVDLEVR